MIIPLEHDDHMPCQFIEKILLIAFYFEHQTPLPVYTEHVALSGNKFGAQSEMQLAAKGSKERRRNRPLWSSTLRN